MEEPQSDQASTSNNIIKNKEMSTLSLMVRSGLSDGLSMSITSATTPPKITIGRLPGSYSPFNLTLQDAKVSRKHAVVTFNPRTQNWVIADLGSKHGTRLNSRLIQRNLFTHRHQLQFQELIYVTALSSGDVLNFGGYVNVLVEIIQNDSVNSLSRSPGIGIASDLMARRLMTDVGLLQYPLPGVEKFGLVGVFDGFGESKAAEIASKTFHENVAKLLSQSGEKEKVLSSDASGILKQAFALTETEINKHVECEGCTATALLIWSGSDGDIFVQCANVGDTECVFFIDGEEIVMTEKHKWNTAEEQERIAETGNPLEEGQSHINGVFLSRMLGSKCIKLKDERFISEPYVSEVQHVPKESTALALVASNGLWDIFAKEQAVEYVLQIKDSMKDQIDYANQVAKYLVKKAKRWCTEDNTTLIFVDFDVLRTYSPSSSD